MRPASAFSLAAAAWVAGCTHLPSGGLQDAIDALTPSDSVVGVARALPPAQRPAFGVGDTYVFGVASVRRVAAVSPTSLTWRTTDGQQMRTGRDFFTPVLQQSLPDRRVTSQLSGQPAALWPLSVGKQVQFEEERTTTVPAFNREFKMQLQWTCEVVDARVSQVPAGDFDTFHVVCNAKRSGFFLPVQTTTWDYAPSLGHYVRRTWFEGGQRRESRLGAALPGSLATAPRVAAMLERLQQMQQP